ncbi:MAG: AlpA family phage regulatory protein [Alphaproteobacteria bacterium]|nr:MAG: AlpA family phage regulatory protein [Alphaproteobacteria bacterium]
MIERILRRRDVEARTGLSRSSIYKKLAEHTFPQPIKLGGRSVGWLETEIEAWIKHCVIDSRHTPKKGGHHG